MSADLLPEPVRATFAVLKAGAESGRLAHGYVVSCSQMEQGRMLAVLMLQWLQCRESDRPCGRCRACLQVAARTHPDVHWIEPESKSRVIKIDQVRALNQTLSQKAFEGGWKAGVLLHADRLNDSSANAFLKTLEEPPDRSLLLLVTERPQELLPTIMSRCQRVHVGQDVDGVVGEVEQAMLTWLRDRGRGRAPAEQAAWINGILSEIRGRAEKEEKARAAEAEEDIDEDLLKARIQTRAIEARMEILRVLYGWERDLLVYATGGGHEALLYPAEREALAAQSAGLKPADLLARIQDIERAARLLEGNVPETSVWEAVLPI